MRECVGSLHLDLGEDLGLEIHPLPKQILEQLQQDNNETSKPKEDRAETQGAAVLGRFRTAVMTVTQG